MSGGTNLCELFGHVCNTVHRTERGGAGRGVVGGLFLQVAASIGAGADACPFLEGSMKCTGFQETGGGRHLRHRHIAT